MGNSCATVEPPQRVLAARPAKPDCRNQSGESEQSEHDERDNPDAEGRYDPQTSPRDSQEEADDRQQPREMWPAAFPSHSKPRPLQSLRKLQLSRRFGIARSLGLVWVLTAQQALQIHL